MPKEPMIQAMVWYKEEDWEKLRNIFDDVHLLPKTYKDWLEKAEEAAGKIQKSGDTVMKVFIDPVTFPEWCAQKGKKTDAEARTELAIEVATKQAFTTGM